eukprot:SAG11_NODE_25718_length_355_cov_0.605469_1_plen_69_part_10
MAQSGRGRTGNTGLRRAIGARKYSCTPPKPETIDPTCRPPPTTTDRRVRHLATAATLLPPPTVCAASAA